MLSSLILKHHFNLQEHIKGIKLPQKVNWLLPYSSPESQRVMTLFYKKYYQDLFPRTPIFGINPGRHGGGLTGIPFTDPVKLKEICNIENSFLKKTELSAKFIYQVIDQWGDPERFYRQFYISSLCPLGFVKDGVNYNYYDDKALTRAVTPFIVQNIWDQIRICKSARTIAYCLGEGKNFTFFKELNHTHGFFEQVIPLPHPRWIMQYRSKSINLFLEMYLHRLAQSSM
jgi:hypothetical protein